MTTPRDVDELASALIDGLLDAEEAAAARRDPVVAERAAAMWAAREAVRAVPPADADRRDLGIAAALDAVEALDFPAHGDAPAPAPRAGDPAGADIGPGSTASAPGGQRPRPDLRPVPGWPPPSPTPPAPGADPGTPPSPTPSAPGGGPRVTPLGPRHAARARPPKRAAWLGAAAAVAVLLALGGLLASNSSSPQSELTSDAPSSAGQDHGASAEAGEETDSSGDSSMAEPDRSAEPPVAGAPTTSGPPRGSVDLGALGSESDLVAAARGAAGNSELAAGAAPSEDAGAGDVAAATCPDPLAASPAPPPVLLRARATLDGAPVEVWVYADGGERVVATDAGCTVVVDSDAPG